MRKLFVLTLAALICSCGGSNDEKPKAAASATTQAQAPAPAPAPTPPAPILVTDQNGMTVYYHDRDESNKSRCNDSCAQYWIPVQPNPGAYSGSSFGTITRKDGTQQVTFEGRPLYTFFNDKKPGDTKGDGKQGIWHALRY